MLRKPDYSDRLDTPQSIKGRGAPSNPEGRFESKSTTREDDGWVVDDESAPRQQTVVTAERARSIISRNASPDLPFLQSINPYRGCEHGCIYCYARPSHGYLNLSAGIDFETRIFAKTNAAEILRNELAKPGYECSPITIGANTDPYQPTERSFRVTRSIIEVLAACEHPFTLITKNAQVMRDIDLFLDLAKKQLVHIFISVTSLDNRLSSTLEPRASAPHARLKAVSALNTAGVPCSVMVAPIIPMVTDCDIEHIVAAARAAGAKVAGYTVVRLPYEVKHLFREWLSLHVPERADHVMSLIQQMRGGRDNDPSFGSRMRGEGKFAELIGQRFKLACRKHGLDQSHDVKLDTSRFKPLRPASPQADFFG